MRWLDRLFGRRGASPAQAGSSMESAIVVSDVAQEYALLEASFGRRGHDWDLVSQALLESGGRYFDRIHLRTGGADVEVFFDVTSTMGR